MNPDEVLRLERQLENYRRVVEQQENLIQVRSPGIEFCAGCKVWFTRFLFLKHTCITPCCELSLRQLLTNQVQSSLGCNCFPPSGSNQKFTF